MVVRKLLQRQLQVDKTQDHHASIHVPSKDKVKDADITHLMAVGDVALRCNRLKVVATSQRQVPCQTTRNLYRRRICILVFCGRTGRWKVHMHERYGVRSRILIDSHQLLDQTDDNNHIEMVPSHPVSDPLYTTVFPRWSNAFEHQTERRQWVWLGSAEMLLSFRCTRTLSMFAHPRAKTTQRMMA
jgi:hypothetical protein